MKVTKCESYNVGKAFDKILALKIFRMFSCHDMYKSGIIVSCQHKINSV